jgi:tRNA (adenine22-N1)-methyltransferase
VWDIGCDHGYLGLHFLNNPKVELIGLVDPSDHVIETLKTNIKDSYITNPDKIKLICKKGQEILIRSDRKKIIYIAGMGGKETKEILIYLSDLLNSDDSIIISPHKNILELRAYLSNSKFRLIKEEIIQENQRFYQIMALGQSAHLPKVTPFGDGLWQGCLAPSYRSYLLSTFKSHQDVLSKDFVTYLENLSC